VMTLTFEKDGAKLPPTPSPPPALPAGTPMPPGMPIPSPTGILPNMGATNNPGMRSLPTRNFRLPANAANKAVISPSLGNSGSLPVSAGVIPAPTGMTQPQDLSAEEQSILQQIQQQTSAPA